MKAHSEFRRDMPTIAALRTLGLVYTRLWTATPAGRDPSDRVARLKEDIDAYHRHYAVPAGLHVKREYLTHHWSPAVSATLRRNHRQ
jgi:hypothetical protein